MLTEGAAERRVKRGCLRGPWLKESAVPFSARPQDLQAERTLTGVGAGGGKDKPRCRREERGSAETSGGGAFVTTRLLRSLPHQPRPSSSCPILLLPPLFLWARNTFPTSSLMTGSISQCSSPSDVKPCLLVAFRDPPTSNQTPYVHVTVVCLLSVLFETTPQSVTRTNPELAFISACASPMLTLTVGATRPTLGRYSWCPPPRR